MPLEILRMNFSILNEADEKNKSSEKSSMRSFEIYGLWLYGAKWSKAKQSIVDLDPEDPHTHPVPTIKISIH